MADILCYLGSYFQIVRTKIDIVGNERHTGSDGDCTCGWMTFGRSEIWLPLG